MKTKSDSFSSRFGLIAATIGMAIGAGNIWRFPRLAGQYGGSFLLPWLLFLFIWSIPLLIVEFSIGKKTQAGTVGSFAKAMGKKYAWMGWFVGFCTSAILFYYSVVCGWSLKYFVLSVSGELAAGGQVAQQGYQSYWDMYVYSVFQPLAYHFFSLAVGAYIIYRGITKGIENFSKIIIPVLFALLIFAAVKALNIDGAEKGISYFFNIKLHDFGNYKLWLDALSQSAWSTGAGWGLLLTYAIYSRKREKIISNSFYTGLGNNLASIIAGLAVIPTVFALSQNVLDTLTKEAAALEILKSNNQGLAFVAIPQLFSDISGGRLFASVFFLALFFAAISSLISMLELATRILADFGFKRRKAVLAVALLTAVLGAPSAVSLDFFNNQDWVWGLGLMLSGFFFNLAVIKLGVHSFVDDWLQPQKYHSFYYAAFKALFYLLIPLEFMLMLGWWLWQSIQWNPTSWWNPLKTDSPATALLQWAVVLALGFLFNKKFSLWLKK